MKKTLCALLALCLMLTLLPFGALAADASGEYGDGLRWTLTADGRLKPCLHSREEICIKGLDEAGMTQTMREAIRMKPRQHEPLSRGEPSRAARQMNQIGG